MLCNSNYQVCSLVGADLKGSHQDRLEVNRQVGEIARPGTGPWLGGVGMVFIPNTPKEW